FVIGESSKKELTYKIQKDNSMSTEEKVNELNKIHLMNNHVSALVYKFIEYSILVSEAQIKMLENMTYDLVISALDETAARGGKVFSYFYEVYKTKENEEMELMKNDFTFIPNFSF
ncbi:MAG: hypothetical protein IJ094_10805, partial [Bacilli bacterium]|nr:hypothetical protein [Bacilli bacterium]